MRILSAAVANESGIATLNIAERGRSSNHLEKVKGRSQSGGSRFQIQVPTVTLDELSARFSVPDLIKLDVEGAKASVLEGAARLVEARQSIWIIEVGSDNAPTVYSNFTVRGYTVFDATVPPSRRFPWNRARTTR